MIVTCYVKDGVKMGPSLSTIDNFKCGDTLHIRPDTHKLYITKDGETITVSLRELFAEYPDIQSIVVCDSATKTTFENCETIETQDLSSLYIQPNGKMYFGGACIYNPYTILYLLLIVVILVVTVVIGAVWLIRRHKKNE